MNSSLKLPLSFDPAQLRADLANVSNDEWTAHFNKQCYEGEWSGVSLRSVGGGTTQLYPDPNAAGKFADTELLGRSPYFREVIDAFECEKEAVRLLRLSAGARILEHRDFKLNHEGGVLRIHIPVASNPGVEFILDGSPVPMLEGESWYLDLTLKHSAANLGETDRVHLIIDCCVNEWTDRLLERAGVEATV